MSLTTVFLSGLDTHWLELTSDTLTAFSPVAAIAASINLDTGEVFLDVTGPDGSHEHMVADAAECCLTCTLREGLLPHLARFHAAGIGAVVVSMPAGLETDFLLPSLLEAAPSAGAAIGACTSVHVVDIDTITDQLAFPQMCPICEALDSTPYAFTEASLEACDLVLALGQDAAGSTTLDRIRPRTLTRVNGLAALDATALLAPATEAADLPPL